MSMGMILSVKSMMTTVIKATVREVVSLVTFVLKLI